MTGTVIWMWLKHSDAPHGTTQQLFLRQELLLPLPYYLNLDLCSVDLWSNCTTTGLNLSLILVASDQSRFVRPAWWRCCQQLVQSNENLLFISVPQGVIIITDLDISLRYTIHKDITLAVVQLWILGCVFGW